MASSHRALSAGCRSCLAWRQALRGAIEVRMPRGASPSTPLCVPLEFLDRLGWLELLRDLQCNLEIIPMAPCKPRLS